MAAKNGKTNRRCPLCAETKHYDAAICRACWRASRVTRSATDEFTQAFAVSKKQVRRIGVERLRTMSDDARAILLKPYRSELPRNIAARERAAARYERVHGRKPVKRIQRQIERAA